MRQWDGVEPMASIDTEDLLADMGFHGPVVHELRDGEFTHGYYQGGSE